MNRVVNCAVLAAHTYVTAIVARENATPLTRDLALIAGGGVGNAVGRIMLKIGPQNPVVTTVSYLGVLVALAVQDKMMQH